MSNFVTLISYHALDLVAFYLLTNESFESGDRCLIHVAYRVPQKTGVPFKSWLRSSDGSDFRDVKIFQWRPAQTVADLWGSKVKITGCLKSRGFSILHQR